MAALSAEQMQDMMAGMQRNLLTAIAETVGHNRASEKEAAASAAATAAATAAETAAKVAATAATAEQKSDKPREERSPKLDLRNFTKVDKFSGGEAAWKDWSFDFKVMVNGINPSMSKWFEKCEKDKENLTPEKAKAYADGNGENHADLEARSKELFALLCMLTDGEAKTIIRGQSDVLVAYQLIHKTYSRITLAKTIRTIREALVPKRAGHIGKTILKKWECKVS